MEVSTVEERLECLKIPVCYRKFDDADRRRGIDPPYIMFTAGETLAGGADDRILFTKTKIAVELYTAKKDELLEGRLEEMIEDCGWTKDEDYIDSEAIWAIRYEFDIFDKVRRKHNGNKH